MDQEFQFSELSFKTRRSLIQLIGVSWNQPRLEFLQVNFDTAAEFPHDIRFECSEGEIYRVLAKSLLAESHLCSMLSAGNKHAALDLTKNAQMIKEVKKATQPRTGEFLTNSQFFFMVLGLCGKNKVRITVPESLVFHKGERYPIRMFTTRNGLVDYESLV